MFTEYAAAITGTFTPGLSNFDLSGAELTVMIVLYLMVGWLLWDRMIDRTEEGSDDLFYRCERIGTIGWAETAAFLTAKGFFIVAWVACVLFWGVCQVFHRIRHFFETNSFTTVP